MSFKNFATIILLITSMQLFAQKSPIGKYSDLFGRNLELKADSTFYFNWSFDMMGGWKSGTWSINGKYIDLNPIDILDTLALTEGNFSRDTLVLSRDYISSSVTHEDYMISMISSGQNTHYLPKRLKFNRNLLMSLDKEQRVIRKRKRGVFNLKKRHVHYLRIKGDSE